MIQRSFILPLLLGVLAVTGCSYLPSFDEVLPDKRTEYRKSQSMPDLEVPPDLTAEAINDSMAIPNEQAATLSRYRRQQAVAPVAGAAVAPAPGNQQGLTVAAGPEEIWPVLRQFFTSRGYAIDVDDAELGVLETGWSEPVTEGGLERRTKFRIFSEPGAAPGTTLLVISGMLGERLPSADGDGAWLERSAGETVEQQMAGELGLRLNQAFAGAPAQASVAAATPAAGAAAPAGTGRGRAEIRNDQEGRIYLSIPEEFTGAWRITGEALQRAGLTIDGKDPAKGVYQVTYYPAPGEEKEGWLSKLAFWKGDEPEGRTYAISVTGQGETTELIVLNEKGDWETNQDAGRILGLIQNEYNSR